MTRNPPGDDGRKKIAENFLANTSLADSKMTRAELEEIAKSFPESYRARLPREGEKMNAVYDGELAFTMAMIRAGLSFPLWPEVVAVLGHYGLVPVQLQPNGYALMLAFICFLRDERVEFDLDAFRKAFIFKATVDGFAYFSGNQMKATQLPNKVHVGVDRYFFVSGPFVRVLYSPEQRSESTYRASRSATASSLKLADFFVGKNFDVDYLRRNIRRSPYVVPGQGTRGCLAVAIIYYSLITIAELLFCRNSPFASSPTVSIHEEPNCC